MSSRTWRALVIVLAFALLACPATASAKAKGPSGVVAGGLRAGSGTGPSIAALASPLSVVPQFAQPATTLRTSSVTALPVDVFQQAEYDWSVNTHVTGLVGNPYPQSLKQVQVYLTWLDVDGNEISTVTHTAWANVIASNDWATFFFDITIRPAGAVDYTITADGVPCSAQPVILSRTLDHFVESGDNTRHWFINVTNSNAFTVTNIIWAAFEYQAPYVPGTQDPDLDQVAFLDMTAPGAGLTTTSLAPGQTIQVEVAGMSPSDPAQDVWLVPRFEGKRSPVVPVGVFRFYNIRTGTHFYTGTTEERDAVISTLGYMYKYEGVAYTIDQWSSSNVVPLYRFYNVRTGTHFYTADESEMNNTLDNLSHIYRLDGITYFVADSPGPGATTVYRFYNVRTGTHFYTATNAERDNVINTMGSIFKYEGPAFYAYGPTT
jgi:hypothetical protein